MKQKILNMRTYQILKSAFALFVFFLFVSLNSEAQTAGTFTFKISPVAHSGSYGSKHLVAMWIENSAGTFVKTKLKQSGNGNLDHLATWTSKSASNVVDATTGATLSSYTPITVVWDGTNVSKAIVPDGIYKIWIELAWDNSKTTGKTVTSFAFTKGTAAEKLTPANSSLFTDISLNWVPVTTGIEAVSQKDKLNVFPNPTTGLISIDLNSHTGDCRIQVESATGTIVYDEQLSKGSSGTKTVDLSRFANGIYLVNLIGQNKAENKTYKVLLKK